MAPTPGYEERRRRRALLRAHHPDLGGDPEEFIRVLAELRSGRTAREPADDVRFVRRPRGLARLTSWLRARTRPQRPRRVI
ncbi:hypothetical protein [Blastococcus sp. TF02A-26]|uniref:hypothetical protein n=1 Tax=Blastococcus sp. TF02A-26 TaxID=2250577 RepID=UPI000DE89E16|nr:hypothetical protein [Blastococcus sp. TF02A-26]RBY79024.1 hypothetical protein DQ240_22745 [Blastococcus sp. TF02A-26]